MVMPDVVDGLGRTLIFVAVTHRKLDVTKFILENASLFDIDKPAKAGNTPLHAAVRPVSIRSHPCVFDLKGGGSSRQSANRYHCLQTGALCGYLPFARRLRPVAWC